jgi:hypothetical protein
MAAVGPPPQQFAENLRTASAELFSDLQRYCAEITMLGLIRLDHLEGDVVRLKLTNIRIRLPYSFLVWIVTQ